MSYEIIKLACQTLNELEKMKLAQYLIQTSIQTMEKTSPKSQANESVNFSKNKVLDNIKKQVLKNRPSKISSMKNVVRSVFRSQGGISNSEIDTILNRLMKDKVFTMKDSKIIYL